MADGYRIIGAEMSPYSVKVRAYFRYKAIRIGGFCAMRQASRNTRNTPKCRSSPSWLRRRALAFKIPHPSSS